MNDNHNFNDMGDSTALIPLVDFKNSNHSNSRCYWDIDICPICLELLNETHTMYTELECRHAFHSPCIVTWLALGHKKCPMCKQRVQTYEELSPLPPSIFSEEFEHNNIMVTRSTKFERFAAIFFTCILLSYLIYINIISRMQF